MPVDQEKCPDCGEYIDDCFCEEAENSEDTEYEDDYDPEVYDKEL